MGRWGDGESTCVRRNTTVEQSGEPVHAKRAAQGEMGRWGDGEMGNLIASKMLALLYTPNSHAQLPITNYQCLMPDAQFPIPHAQCPMPNAPCPIPLMSYTDESDCYNT